MNSEDQKRSLWVGHQRALPSGRRFACLLGVTAIALISTAQPAAAQVAVVQPTLVQTIATSSFSPSSPDPAGITYMPASDRFLISDSEVDEMTLYSGSNLFTATRNGSGTGTGTSVNRFGKEPSGLGFNPTDSTLFVSDDDANRVNVVKPGIDAVHGTSDDIVTKFSTSFFGSTDPEGVEYDAATGHVFICDGRGLEVYRVDPVNGTFGDGNDVVTSFDLARYGARDCEGIGIDAQRSTLLAVDPSREKIYELSKSGDHVRTLDLSGIPTTSTTFASVTMAPTSYAGDSPSAMSYWVVDRHVDNGANPAENDGLLYELTLGTPPPPTDAPPTIAITAPAESATVSATTVVSANASDDVGVSQVTVSVDGTVIGTDTNANDGWSVPWDTTSVADGAHTITATATDGAGQTASDSNNVTVNNDSQSSVTLSIPITSGTNDADETQDGTVRRTTGDIELGSESAGVLTTAGLRFTGVAIPQGATITSAHLQFQTDEKNGNPANITFRAQQSDNAPALATTAFDISSRPRTTASVAWAAPQWLVLGAAGADQRTPNLSPVLQEVVDRPGWSSGNAAVIIATGSGRRTAESFEGGAPPVLHVEYATP